MKSKYKIILASNSPRRKELLSGLDLEYDSIVLPDIEETYPVDMEPKDVAQYIAKKKASAYKSLLTGNALVITGDTIVVIDGKILVKPKDEAEAKKMLRKLSGKTHQVITGVCLTASHKQKNFSVTSDVKFSYLDDSEIEYYVSKYKPLDKAGAYGIQEWIGYIAVEHINGSYFNVMGLPIQRLYKELKTF